MKNFSFEILDAPENAKLFDPNIIWVPKLVDYAAHPAYAALIAEANFGRKLKSRVRFYKSMMPLLVKRLIRYEMIPREIREPSNLVDWFKLIGTSLHNGLGLHSKNKQEKKTSEVFKTLDANGLCVLQMEDSLFTELENVAQEHFDRLEKQRNRTQSDDREFDESRGSVDAREYGNQLYKTINGILENAGILDAASKYMGRKAKLVDGNPQINDSSDTFWLKVFPDMKLEDIPITAYHHRDASGGDLKAIFYMSDVGPNNGPFSYAIGSHKLHIPRVDDLIAEANDFNGMSGTTLEMRRLFSALPEKLRQKGTFGNDLVEQSILSKEIEKSVWKITGSKGSIVLFDTKGIHRGGMVSSGDRRVITNVVG